MPEAPPPRRLDRRSFVRITATSAGFAAAGGLTFLTGCGRDETLLGPDGQPLFAPGGVPGPPDGGGGGVAVAVGAPLGISFAFRRRGVPRTSPLLRRWSTWAAA